MRKLLSALFVLAAVFMMSNTAFAQDAGGNAAKRADGKVGVGFNISDAPIGVRFWLNRNLGFDANLGFNVNFDGTDASGNDSAILDSFNLDLGVLFSIWVKDDGQSRAFVRAGYALDRDYAVGSDNMGMPTDSANVTHFVSAGFGAEYYLTALGLPRLALQGFINLGFEIVSPAEVAGESDTITRFRTEGQNLSIVNATFGFHYYFF